MKRRTLLLCLILTLSGALPGAARQDRARELLDLHILWLGGRERIAALQDASARGSIEVAGLSGTLEVIRHRDGYQRTTFDLKVVAGVELITPEGGWELNTSGQREPMDEAKLAAKRAALKLSFSGHVLSGEAEYLGAEEKDGRAWEVVRFSGEDGSFTDLFLDPGDGSQIWTRSGQGDDETWTRADDWRLVDGLRMAFRLTAAVGVANGETRIVWDELALDQGLVAADFSAPREGRQVVRFPDGVTRTEWTPLSLCDERYIYIPCRMNGIETELLLDSGAGITVLDASFAAQAGIAGAGQITATGTSGSSGASLATGIEIAVGGVVLSDLTVAIIDLSEVTERMGRSMPVILGKEIFINAVVDIDYPGRRIAFHRADAFTYAERGHSLRLFPGKDGRRLVEAAIEGRPPARFLLDTGSGSTVTLFDAYTREVGLLEGREGLSTGYGGGVGGGMAMKLATLEDFVFAGYRLEQVPASFTPPTEGGFGTDDFAGNLGAGIFGRFRMIFDFGRERLHVEGHEGWDELPFRKYHLGLTCDKKDEGFVVIHVAVGSPAEKAGFREGERLLAVDGKPLEQETWSQRLRDIGRGPVGSTVTFTLADGSERRVELAEYY